MKMDLTYRAAGIGVALLLASTSTARADCMTLLPLFQQGGGAAEIAQLTGLPFAQVESCRRELSRPIVIGPDGAPPVGAAGPPPVGAAGPPPVGAMGRPPVGAAGPPPVGHVVRRLQ